MDIFFFHAWTKLRHRVKQLLLSFLCHRQYRTSFKKELVKLNSSQPHIKKTSGPDDYKLQLAFVIIGVKHG